MGAGRVDIAVRPGAAHAGAFDAFDTVEGFKQPTLHLYTHACMHAFIPC